MAALDLLGFGTMEYSCGSHGPEALFDATKHALATGFRHIDTAEMYTSTNEHVARAIAESGVPRDQLFVTSKLSGLPLGTIDDVVARTHALLTQMRLEHFDLLLIHWPGPSELNLATQSPDEVTAACSFEWFATHIAEAWRNMLELQRRGLTRHIGVSNFYRRHIDELLRHFPDVAHRPFANQIFIDIAHQEREFVAYLESLNVRVIAYRPVAFVNALAMLESMGDSDATAAIAAAHAATNIQSAHQLVLATLMARGIAVLVKSSSPEHIAENYAARSLTIPDASSLLIELDNNETIAMCGAFDEYAAAFKAAATDDASQ